MLAMSADEGLSDPRLGREVKGVDCMAARVNEDEFGGEAVPVR